MGGEFVGLFFFFVILQMTMLLEKEIIAGVKIVMSESVGQ